jgi:hypothetical protein
MKLDLLFKFSVTRELDEKFHKMDIGYFLIDDEIIDLAYTHERDKVWFTNKRIFILDIKGLSGNKKEYRSFPYSKISSFSVETAGFLDGDSDFKIWVSGIGLFTIKFHKKLDIKKIGKYLSKKIM